MRSRRLTAFVAATLLLVSACGGSNPAEPAAESAAELPPNDAEADEPAATDEPVTESPADDDAADAPAQDLPAGEPANDAGDANADEPATDEPETANEPATDAPDDAPDDADEPEAASDGCSVDGSPTALESAAGPLPEIAVTEAAAAASPLPAVAVRRINCDGGWVQLKNEIPADLPLLIWFWAPH